MENGKQRVRSPAAIGPVEPSVPARQGSAPALLGWDFRGPGAEQWGLPLLEMSSVMKEQRALARHWSMNDHSGGDCTIVNLGKGKRGPFFVSHRN